MNLLTNLSATPVTPHTHLDITSVFYQQQKKQNKENYAEMDAKTMAEVVSDKLIEVLRKELEKAKIIVEQATASKAAAV
ncbi:MAG: hypothetical protein R2830_11515 [Saprospiraceae bacterium]